MISCFWGWPHWRWTWEIVWHILGVETDGLRGLAGLVMFLWMVESWMEMSKMFCGVGSGKRRLGTPSSFYGTPISVVDHCAPLTNNRGVGPIPIAQRGH